MEDSPEFQCPHADVLACHKSAHVGIGIQGCLPFNLITPCTPGGFQDIVVEREGDQ